MIQSQNAPGLRAWLGEIASSREVISSLLYQDIKVKYRGTVLGYLWSLLHPILQLAVLSVVFSQIVKVQIEHYTIYLFAGLVPWNFFSNAIISSSRIYLENEFFLKKVYFPKLIFPLSRTLMCLVDFTSALVALGFLGVFLGLQVSSALLLLPLGMLSLFLFTLGAVTLFSFFTVFFRDLQYLATVAIQLLYFLTPIIYTPDMIPEKYRFYFMLNPLYWQIHLFQKMIYFRELPTMYEASMAFAVSVSILAISLLVMRRYEKEIVFRL